MSIMSARHGHPPCRERQRSSILLPSPMLPSVIVTDFGRLDSNADGRKEEERCDGEIQRW
jgi:hypothetical protein